MDKIIKLTTPLTADVIRSLRAGQHVRVNGTIYAARDIAHKRLSELIDAHAELPFVLQGAIIYYLGPSPAGPGRVIGAAGPTTSSRMDPFTPKLLANGLRATIGKGYRGNEVTQALKKHAAVHLATVGGAGALLSKHITSAKVIAFEDLAAEAVRELQVVDFPAVVAYDSYGGDVYNA